MTKMQLIDEAVMVSDNIALLYEIKSTGDIRITAISMWRPKYKAFIDFNTLKVSSSNMSKNLLERAVAAIERNKELLLGEINEREAEKYSNR